MRPLILDYKLSRIDDGKRPSYEYDPTKSLNMIEVNGINKPFIQTRNSDIELETKTKAYQEQDDDNFRLELSTKTFTKIERDDEGFNFLEMETKTLTTRERDDEHFDNYQ